MANNQEGDVVNDQEGDVVNDQEGVWLMIKRGCG